MAQQMTPGQRLVVTIAIQKASTRPNDIEDCVKVVTQENPPVFSMEKVQDFWDEFKEVCQQAMSAMGTVPATPPRSNSCPPRSAHTVPGTRHGALLAAARGSRHMTPDSVYLAIHGAFEYASARYTDAEFSYILQKTAKSLRLQCRNGSIQIRWKEYVPTLDGDHTARATVFIIVSEEEAADVEMNVDILLGKHYREDPDVQLQAFFAYMGYQSAPSCEVHPRHSCVYSVAEAACPTCPTCALQPTASGSREAPHSTAARRSAPCSPASGRGIPETTEGSRHGHRHSVPKRVLNLKKLKTLGKGAHNLQRLAFTTPRKTQKGVKKKRPGVRDRQASGRETH